MQEGLTAEMALRFSGLVLSNGTREYPNKMDHVMLDAADVKGPRALHPLFYGSFDWHSCVHSYWLLSRIYRLHPALPESTTIRRVINQNFTLENVAGELDYLKGPAHRSFERPYGMAWLLMLAAELARHTSVEGRRWFDALSTLATECASRSRGPWGWNMLAFVATNHSPRYCGKSAVRGSGMTQTAQHGSLTARIFFH